MVIRNHGKLCTTVFGSRDLRIPNCTNSDTYVYVELPSRRQRYNSYSC